MGVCQDVNNLFCLLDERRIEISSVRALKTPRVSTVLTELKISALYGSEYDTITWLRCLFYFLDQKEESDSGKTFHPVKVVASSGAWLDVPFILQNLRGYLAE